MDRFDKISTQDFLTENYHFLACCTRVDSFLSWLRSKDVLSVCEMEEIQAMKTSKSKSARLIDTIEYKGDRGFLAYMQVLEWTYPDVFSSITEFKGIEQNGSSRKSAVLIQELQKCMGNIVEDNLCKKENIFRLKETVSKLQNESEMMISEMRQLQSKLQNLTNINCEHSAVIKKLEEENMTLKVEKDEKEKKLKEKTNELLELYMNKVSCNNINKNTNNNINNNINDNNHTRKIGYDDNKKPLISPKPAHTNNGMILQQEQKQQKKTLLDHQSSFQNVNNSLEDEFEHLKTKLAKFKDELNEKQLEIDKLTKTNDQLLDLNQRINSDYQKAIKAYEQQHETVEFLRKENGKMNKLEKASSDRLVLF
ncbi:hypothetical protein HELRODRAFT_181401 [Helobdella robusta]|uniref:CARD domain-containing protein n=1 Tax=Helobdella robusta TaxID=6412 RepID=T1FGY9_HELRO|nr:hypothetical protein HELRODRAFT_181401 [Helobdella robusta]ESN92525.1 hypothetical protein HELRODRAFT_181401 [Helobdella robusta]